MMTMTRTVCAVAVLASVAGAAPVFTVAPLTPPPGAVGFRPFIQVGATIAFGNGEIKDFFGDSIEGQAATVAIHQASTAGAFVDVEGGFDWRVCRRVIEGEVFSHFDGAAAEVGDFTWFSAGIQIDSPTVPPSGVPLVPRFELIEGADVRITWQASSVATGSMHQHNVSFLVNDPHAPAPGVFFEYVEFSGGENEPAWSDSGDSIVHLEAGSYNLHAVVSQQGNMFITEEHPFDAAMSAHTSLSFRLEIVVPPACAADVTGDGAVNFDDLNAVLTDWSAAGSDADADCSGLVDFDDLNAVLGAWDQVCP